MLYIINGKNEFFTNNKIKEILLPYDNRKLQVKKFVSPNFADFYYDAVASDIFSKLKVLVATEIENTFLDYITKDKCQIFFDLVNANNVIILIFNKINKKFLMNLKNNTEKLNIFNIDTKYITKTVENIFLKYNIPISRYNLNRILDSYQDNMYLLEQKLSTLSYKKDSSLAIHTDVVEELLYNEMLQPNLFLLIDLIADRNSIKVQKFLKLYFLHKQNSLALLNFLITNFRIIFKVKLLSEKNIANRKIAELLNLHPYRVKKIIETDFLCSKINKYSYRVKKIIETDFLCSKINKYLNSMIDAQIEIKSGNNHERVIKKLLLGLIKI